MARPPRPQAGRAWLTGNPAVSSNSGSTWGWGSCSPVARWSATLSVITDKAFGTSWLTLVFLLLGIAAGFIELFREMNASSK